jgi:hypothetical protein
MTGQRMNITGNGVEVGGEINAERLATAAAFLRLLRPTKGAGPRSPSSYWLKHLAERWGEANGLSPYVNNGELILAAVALGLRVHWGGGLNVGIGVRLEDLRTSRVLPRPHPPRAIAPPVFR